MNERHTCHAKIIHESITFPDPDGEGNVTAHKGEIRLMVRDDAKEFEVEGSVQILTDEEAKEAGLK